MSRVAERERHHGDWITRWGEKSGAVYKSCPRCGIRREVKPKRGCDLCWDCKRSDPKVFDKPMRLAGSDD